MAFRALVSIYVCLLLASGAVAQPAAPDSGQPWQVSKRTDKGVWKHHNDFRSEELAVGGAQRTCISRGRGSDVIVAARISHQGKVHREFRCVQEKAQETKP